MPYPPGGGTDIIGRTLAARLGEAWGQTVIVENRAGASGVIGNDLVAKAAPDGYTVLIGITTLIQMPHLQPKLPYDVFRDFTPITQIAYSADLFAVPPSSPFQSLGQFVEAARAHPGRFNYGSYGNGTSSHIHGEMFNAQARLDLAHVPFKGSAPLLTDLIGGQLTSAFVDVSSASAQLEAGKLRVLAITGERRFKALPEVPTFTELGYRDFEPYGWFAALLPAGAPPEVVRKLSGELMRIIRWMPTLPEISRLSPAASTNTQALWQLEPSRTQMVQPDSPMLSPATIAASTWPPLESRSRMRLPMPSASATTASRDIIAAKAGLILPT